MSKSLWNSVAKTPEKKQTDQLVTSTESFTEAVLSKEEVRDLYKSLRERIIQLRIADYYDQLNIHQENDDW